MTQKKTTIDKLAHLGWCLFLLTCLWPSAAWAAIGLPDRTSQIGFASGATQLSVNEPEKNHTNTLADRSYVFLYTDTLDSKLRYLLDFHYQTAAIEPEETRAGQNIQAYGTSLSLQRKIAGIRYFSPWIGAGIKLDRNHFYTRHTVTADGFLGEHLPSRSVTSLGFLVNAAADWEVENNWRVGALLEHAAAPGSAVDTTSGLLYFLFQLQ